MSRSTAGRSGPPSSGRPAPGCASDGWTAHDGPPLYVGRIGLSEGDDDDTTALLDWRAPAARPFYCATLATPMGLTRRRHFAARRDRAGRAGHRHSRRRLRRGPHRRPGHRGRSGAAGRALRAARHGDARHRLHDPGRTGRRDPAAAGGRGRDRGRPGHREDRGRAAPGGLPPLHPPRPAGPPRRARGRAERAVPGLRRGRAAVARRDGRRVHHARQAPPRRRRHGHRPPAGRPDQGRPGDVRGPAPGGGRRADRCPTNRSRSRSTPSRWRSTARSPRGPGTVRATAGGRTTRPGWSSPRAWSRSSSSAAST